MFKKETGVKIPFAADKKDTCHVVLFDEVETRLQSRMEVLCPTKQNFA